MSDDATRERLVADREATSARVDALAADLAGIIDASTSVATDDEHDPEGSTIAFERAQVAALLDQARGHLVDVDRALARIGDGSYGVCVGCGRGIGEERLAARPAATTCVACASAARR